MRKLLILLGAGSSIPQGMPSVWHLDDLMKQWATAWEVFDGRPIYENYFAHTWENLETYFRGARKHLELQPNFELALGQMVALSNWLRPEPHGNPLRLMAANGALPSGIRFTDLLSHRPVPSEGFGPSSLVNSQLTYLLRKLACHMREKSRAFDTSTDQFARYSLLLERLRARFEVGIYTSNYDMVALAAWPDAFTGFTRETYRRNRRRFDPRAVHTRSEWGYLYHLHGSVHYTVADHDTDQPLAEEITWQDDLTDKFEDGHEGRSTDARSEGNEFPRTSLIVGGFKLDQLLIEPYQTLYSSLVRHAYDVDAIFIGGYGFSDVYVNRL